MLCYQSSQGLANSPKLSIRIPFFSFLLTNGDVMKKGKEEFDAKPFLNFLFLPLCFQLDTALADYGRTHWILNMSIQNFLDTNQCLKRHLASMQGSAKTPQGISKRCRSWKVTPSFPRLLTSQRHMPSSPHGKIHMPLGLKKKKKKKENVLEKEKERQGEERRRNRGKKE